jgi:hypothetical protein
MNYQYYNWEKKKEKSIKDSTSFRYGLRPHHKKELIETTIK